MTLREEFEKAFDEAWETRETSYEIALWAAKWTTERCAIEIDNEIFTYDRVRHAEMCRNVAKELDKL